jgi:hypothetical protein
MRTITRIRTARTMGRVFIFASSPSPALTWFVDPHLRRFYRSLSMSMDIVVDVNLTC